MSCEACDVAQERGVKTYYRLGAANLELSGCDQHLREAFTAFDLWNAMDNVLDQPRRQQLLELRENRPIIKTKPEGP